jgi:hypothetical protein
MHRRPELLDRETPSLQRKHDSAHGRMKEGAQVTAHNHRRLVFPAPQIGGEKSLLILILYHRGFHVTAFANAGNQVPVV